MRKSIKLLVCILIAIIAIPLNCYAFQYTEEELDSLGLEELIGEYEKCIHTSPLGVGSQYESGYVAAGYSKEEAKEKVKPYRDKVFKNLLGKLMNISINDRSEFTKYNTIVENIKNSGYTGDMSDVEERFSNIAIIYYSAQEIADHIDEKYQEYYDTINPNAIVAFTEDGTTYVYGDANKDDAVLHVLKNEYIPSLSDEIIIEWEKTLTNSALFNGTKVNGGTIRTWIQEERSRRELYYTFEDIDNLEFWKPTNSGGNTEIKTKAGKILGAIQIMGSIASALALVVLGIKYMIGSVSEKAKYKETMIPYIIGCVMLFAITNIASILYKIGTNLNN